MLIYIKHAYVDIYLFHKYSYMHSYTNIPTYMFVLCILLYKENTAFISKNTIFISKNTIFISWRKFHISLYKSTSFLLLALLFYAHIIM